MFRKVKLVFVITVENGRVKSEDVSTFRRVMAAMLHTDIQHKILLVFNKLRKKPYKQYSEDLAKAVGIAICVLGPTIQPKDIVLLPWLEELEDEEDKITSLPELKAALNCTPAIDIDPEKIADIESGDQSVQIAALERQIIEIKKMYKEAMEKREAEVRAEIARWEAEVRKRKSENEKTASNLEAERRERLKSEERQKKEKEELTKKMEKLQTKIADDASSSKGHVTVEYHHHEHDSWCSIM